jgi:hypothetical protein
MIESTKKKLIIRRYEHEYTNFYDRNIYILWAILEMVQKKNITIHLLLSNFHTHKDIVESFRVKNLLK